MTDTDPQRIAAVAGELTYSQPAARQRAYRFRPPATVAGP